MKRYERSTCMLTSISLMVPIAEMAYSVHLAC
jgi:hypothetical protein